MRGIRFTCLAVVAVMASFAIAAATASAEEFIANNGGALSGKATSTQAFTTKAGKIECTKLSVTGEVEELATETQLAIVTYENCTAFASFPPKSRRLNIYL
ncbi:MAG TPA: hypothetical protein VGP17_05400 [Solirubrobacteraceae bacterium]|jgi:hypothetical protein|nr:hypothetical protein [Solirubrobacteraceae bacterium]